MKRNTKALKDKVAMMSTSEKIMNFCFILELTQEEIEGQLKERNDE